MISDPASGKGRDRLGGPCGECVFLCFPWQKSPGSTQTVLGECREPYALCGVGCGLILLLSFSLRTFRQVGLRAGYIGS